MPAASRLVAFVLAAGVATAGCGASSGASEPEGATDNAGGAFPVTIKHKFGSTEITEAPRRVVTVGLTDHDTALALGVTPVALVDWFGNQPSGTWPWAQQELGDAQPVTLSADELNFERIAGLRPDLILGVNSGLTEKEYQTLSRIAPTVAQSGKYVNYGTPWQKQTRVIGRALGRSARAEELIAKVQETFSKVREQHPEFRGSVGIMAMTGSGGNYYPYQSQDARGRFLTALGFRVPAKIDRLAGEGFYATISREQLKLVGKADVLIWLVNSPAQAKALRQDPLYQQLDVAREGRDIFLPTNGPLAGALSYNNVLSLPYAIEKLTPMVEAAVDGDSATKPGGSGGSKVAADAATAAAG